MQLVKSIASTLPSRPCGDIASSLRRREAALAHCTPLIYALHSSEMYGTERMALATAQGLAGDFEIIFIGPRGPALDEARKLGFETRSFQTIPKLVATLWEILRRFDCLTFVSTVPRYSAICMVLNVFLRRRIRHVQMIHGGGDERTDFAGLANFNAFDMTFVTVSDYSKERMIHHGVPPDRIAVVGNFLTEQQLASMARRAQYDRDGVRTVAVVSRVDPPKRVDLLLDALDRRGAELADVTFRILGWGPDLERLQARAAKSHPNVQFTGYVDNVAAELAKADLLLHTCPVEAFGLAVLEAMEVNLATLVPDRGGTARLVSDGVTGFTFRADDPDHLAARLVELKNAPAQLLNRIARDARASCETRFSAGVSIRKYRQLFTPLNI